MKLKKLGFVICFVLFFAMFTSCGKKDIKADYSIVEAENKLNVGDDLDGKTVEFVVKKLAPDSSFGYNLWAGEHLNFVSEENPKIKQGETVIVEVENVRNVAGSFIIKYKLLENKGIQKTQDSSSSKEDTQEELFDSFVSKVESINKDNYDESEYGYYDYKELLRTPEANLGLKVKIINFKIIQLIEVGDYTQILGDTPNGDIYMALIETKRLDTKLLEGDMLYFNSQFLTDYKYINKAGTEKEVPLLYINGYRLSEK